MAKTFREWNLDQQWLLPPSVRDFVPEGHLAHFVRDTVREDLDLSEILDAYTEARGYPPYHPVMMTALLLYAYTQGVYSSRRIARACEQRVDFMAVTGMSKPDFRTISEFRRRHLASLGACFRQILRLCARAGLVKLGHVALDGTKIKANASKHKAMSYKRMKAADRRLAEEIASWFEEADAIDEAEDEEFGEEVRGDELPEWVANKVKRREKIREAMAELEAEAKAQEKRKKQARKGGPKGRRGRKPKHPPGVPKDSAQRNFTDGDSRIMKTMDGFQQSYNAQAAVDADSQVIVACYLTNSATDRHQLKPGVKQIKENLGRQAKELSADADYCTEENLTELRRRHISGYIAVGRQMHGQPVPSQGRRIPHGTRRYDMLTKLRRGGWQSRYRLRKQTVEPVFGQIKHARGFRQFLLRGIDKVRGEWTLICAAHNLLKLAAATRSGYPDLVRMSAYSS